MLSFPTILLNIFSLIWAQILLILIKDTEDKSYPETHIIVFDVKIGNSSVQ